MSLGSITVRNHTLSGNPIVDEGGEVNDVLHLIMRDPGVLANG